MEEEEEEAKKSVQGFPQQKQKKQSFSRTHNKILCIAHFRASQNLYVTLLKIRDSASSKVEQQQQQHRIGAILVEIVQQF